MLSQRYTIAIADLKSGTERRRTVSLGTVIAAIGAVVLLPVLAALGAAFGAAWKARGDVQALSASHRALEIETANYRAAVEALTGQIRSQHSPPSPGPGAESAGSSESARFDPPAGTTVERSTPAPSAPPVRGPAPEPPVRALAPEPPLRVRTPEAPLRAPVPEPPVRVPAVESEPAVAVVAPVPPPAVNGDRGADPDAPGRAAYAEAIARLSQTRALAEAAEAPSLASRSYRAAVDLELDAQQLSKAGRLSDAVVRVVEANGRFRAAEIEARLEAAARERLRLAAAAAAPPPAPVRPSAAETREAPAAPADATRVESRPPAPAPRPADVENAVRQVIAQYVRGLESRSVAALKRVWPSLGGSQERAIQTEFQNARTVRALFTDPQITITGDTTTVTGFRTYNLVTLDGQRLSSLTRTTMTLRRRGEEWLIERIVHQQ